LKTIRIVIDLANSPHTVLEAGEALNLFKCLEEETSGSRDLMESIRIIENFDEFLRVIRRKFENYITPMKDHAESVMGKTIVHKIRLFKEDDKRMVEVIYDRRFKLDILKKCLNKIGYTDIQVEKQYV